MEADIDRLIEDPRLYEIVPSMAGINSVGEGVFLPWAQIEKDFFWHRDVGRGGRIHFNPLPRDVYRTESGHAPHTAGTVLAHELLGRAIADYHREPTDKLGTPLRDRAGELAVQRANPAFDRMEVPRRKGYR